MADALSSCRRVQMAFDATGTHKHSEKVKNSKRKNGRGLKLKDGQSRAPSTGILVREQSPAFASDKLAVRPARKATLGRRSPRPERSATHNTAKRNLPDRAWRFGPTATLSGRGETDFRFWIFDFGFWILRNEGAGDGRVGYPRAGAEPSAPTTLPSRKCPTELGIGPTAALSGRSDNALPVPVAS